MTTKNNQAKELCIYIFMIILATLPDVSFGSQSSKIEIMPFYGQRIGGNFKEITSGTNLDIRDGEITGIAAAFEYERDTQLELSYSLQSTKLTAGTSVTSTALFDLDIEYIHLSGIRTSSIDRSMEKFFGGGVGLAIFDPDLRAADDATRFSFMFLGGVKKWLSEAVGIRFEARAYWTMLDSGSAIFCSGGGCSVSVAGTVLSQYEANLGMSVRF